jgi:hypothetical protein
MVNFRFFANKGAACAPPGLTPTNPNQTTVYLGFPAQLTGREDFCFYSGSLLLLILLLLLLLLGFSAAGKTLVFTHDLSSSYYHL